jgi:hypothetical protein
MAAHTGAHWADVLQLRDEVRGSDGSIGELQMSLHKAVYQTVDAPYRKVDYYSDITQPTSSLIGFFAQVARKLGSDTEGYALFHLDQGMGGGKSHSLVGLFHMANNPEAFFATDLGHAVEKEATAYGRAIDLSGTRPVILCADHFSPGKPTENFGPATTLFERFLWGLFDGDHARYDEYVAQGTNKDTLQRALQAVERPVLILLDELMDYAQELSDASNEGRMPGEQAFLNALMDACDDVPRAAFVVVMIRSELDEAGYRATAQEFRSYISARLGRNGVSVSVSESQDFAAIIRRRLFEVPDAPLPSRLLADRYEAAADDAWRGKVLDRLGQGHSLVGLADRITGAYPFHPDLMALVQDEWSRVQGFQRVRSTVSIFAKTALHWVTEHEQGRWAPPLIGIGDMPLTVALGALLSSGLLLGNDKSIRGYRAVAQTDITTADGTGGRAVAIDERLREERVDAAQPAPAVRMATALFCYSLVSRPQGKRGATKPEILASILLPANGASVNFGAAEEVFNALTGDSGLGALEIQQPSSGGVARYRLSVDQTARMYYTAARQLVPAGASGTLVWETARGKLQKGPFDQRVLVDAADASVPLDRVFGKVDSQGETRLLVLDPRRWTLLNGRDESTRADIEALFGLGPNALRVDNAASCVVACVNMQRRDRAVKRASDVLAWRLVLNQLTEDQGDVRAEATVALREAEKKLNSELTTAFQHYVYLSRRDQRLVIEYERFEDEAHTSLSGHDVWGALVVHSRAVSSGGLAPGYLAALLDGFDRDLTLKEVVQAFYKNPAFPLVPSTDEIRRVIAAMLVPPGGQPDGDREWVIVDGDGNRLAIESDQQIAIGSLNQTLRRYVPALVPQPPTPLPADGADDIAIGPTGQATVEVLTPEPITGQRTATAPVSSTAAADYRRYTLRLENRSLTDPAARERVWRLMRELGKILDPAAAADHQLLDLSLTLTTRDGDQGEIEDRARDADGTARSEADEF